jgi:hypothetical protein
VPNPPRTPRDVRDAVADDIRTLALAGDPAGSVRAIAHRHNISKATVGVIADEYELSHAWSEGAAQTTAATEARRTYIAAQRARLQEDLLDGAADLLERMQDDIVHLNVVKNMGENAGESVEQTELPPGPGDYRSMAAAITSFTKAAVELAKLDNDNTSTASTVSLLDQFALDLQADRDKREQAGGDAP